jgi:hypothetical protein
MNEAGPSSDSAGATSDALFEMAIVLAGCLDDLLVDIAGIHLNRWGFVVLLTQFSGLESSEESKVESMDVWVLIGANKRILGRQTAT